MHCRKPHSDYLGYLARARRQCIVTERLVVRGRDPSSSYESYPIVPHLTLPHSILAGGQPDAQAIQIQIAMVRAAPRGELPVLYAQTRGRFN